MRALALFSGGLDSMLAIKLITLQNIEVTALFIDVGFGSRNDKSEILKKRAEMVGADFEIIDAKEGFVQNILFNPKYGYGKNFNPCIDCHANMIRVAKTLLPKYNASFIITGEVIGQRPMSQRVEAIKQVTSLANESEEGIILRPLSAKKMPITKPEKEGWVDREKLLAIQGRNREIQLKLAKEYGFTEYESPGGGCLLTDIGFSNRIKEHIKYRNFTIEDIEILKVGRHFRLKDGAKLIVGRNREENERIAKIKHPNFNFIKLINLVGPLSMLEKDATEEERELASRIILTYTKAKKDEIYSLKFGNEIIRNSPFESKEMCRSYFA